LRPSRRGAREGRRLQGSGQSLGCRGGTPRRKTLRTRPPERASATRSVFLRRKRAVERAAEAGSRNQGVSFFGGSWLLSERRKQARATKECPSTADAGYSAPSLRSVAPPPVKPFAHSPPSSVALGARGPQSSLHVGRGSGYGLGWHELTSSTCTKPSRMFSLTRRLYRASGRGW
jgi:hypothetical protein